jgi:peptidoglycan/LPS O-acetylase OafA/YrhL
VVSEPADPITLSPTQWPALDGIRALAVLAVFLLHNDLWVRIHNGGYGVEIFFVLSGFLITTLLLREHHRLGRIRLWRFWSRRLARLYPALIALVATSATYAALSHRSDLPGQHRLDTAANIARSVLPPLFYVTNLFLPQHHYFGGHVHTWSLAVEEQFYVVLPLVLIVVLRQRHAREILLIAVTGLAVAFQLWRLLLWRYAYANHVLQPVRWWYPNYVRVFIETDRADTLLYGVLLAAAIWYFGSCRWLQRVLVWSAPLALVFVTWIVTIGPRRIFGLVYYPHLVFGVACALVVGGIVVRPAGPLSVTLALAPLVWFGQRSYSFYLWHFLIIRAFISDTQFGLGAPAVTAVRFCLSLVAAAISTAFIERPIRSWWNARLDAPAAWPPPVTSALLAH